MTLRLPILPKPKKASVPETIVKQSSPARENINEYRRNRYRHDPEYRDRVLAQNRAARRKTEEGQYAIDYEEAIKILDRHMKLTTVIKPKGEKIDVPALSLRGLSFCIGRDYHTVTSWVKRGLLPAPILKVAGGLNANRTVYHREEIVAITGELVRHFRTVARYNQSHTTTASRILAAVGKVRTQLRMGI